MSDNSILSEEKINSICGSIPDIEKMENLRLEVKRRARIRTWYLVGGILLLAGIFMIFSKSADRGMIMTVGLIVLMVLSAIVHFAWVHPPLKKLRLLFNKNIITHYITSIMPGAKYAPEKYHPLSIYYESRLFMIDADRYSGANYVEGMFDKTKLSFSYMHTEYKQVTRTKKGTETTWHTIFKGIFMCADSNKNFAGTTLVLPDTAEKYLGGFGKWLQKQAGSPVGEMVYMENVKFEKEFVVYSTDPVEARYLITPKIQEQIHDMKTLLKNDVRLSFVNNHVFIAISRSDIFTLNTSLPFTDPKTLRYYMKDIIELLTLVHLLDLNIRIWGR
ncbi:MAG: DUF3137 domain-containing protein [Prevotellaceae bacterium]|jgi:hypothetical protein|nr:DUF3137 domain-containing protein [Prevotellaceae bacterium]